MRLTVETGPLAGTVVSLDRDNPAVIGSGTGCALRIQEAGVLAEHAVVKALRGEGFGLKALGDGVRVNGEQIEATPLVDGDVIEIATTRIAFGETQKKGLPAISGYRIEEELGRGGMGVVYCAEQVSLHRRVALKVLSHDLTEDPKFVANFVAEAQAAAKLQHPNVVSVFDVEHDGDTYFYAMELMQSGSCEDWLKQNGAMPVDRALQVVADAAEGLAYAESLGIVHRDIKPDNLMLDQHGVIKIADLGLAHTEAEGGSHAGTPHFMAPEQVLRKPIDHRTDLYALGCTFYRLVTSRTPFRGNTVKEILRAQVKDEAEPAHKINSEVPTEVSAIIQRLMAKEPDDRFPTANALLEELAVLMQPPAKKGLWIALAASAVIIAGAATYWAVNKRGETVTVTEYTNNPEAARLAKENTELKDAMRRDKATIALLSARVSGLVDEPLAQALEKVASDHPDTGAAIEAKRRASAVRTELTNRAQLEQRLQQQVRDHLAAVETSLTPQLQAHDYALALQTLQKPIPTAIRDDAALLAGIARLQRSVVDAARARLEELGKAVDDAISTQDTEKLGPAVDLLADNLAARGRWPDDLAAEIEAGGSRVKAGRTAIAGLMRAVREGLWQEYRALFTDPDGIGRRVESFDFDGAAAIAEQFAAGAGAEEAGTRAAGIALVARAAGLFAVALTTEFGKGDLTFESGDGLVLGIRAWDRNSGQLTVFDTSKRSPRDQQVSHDALSADDWARLSRSVGGTDRGERECFLAFVLLSRHAAAARAYLGAFDPANDASGIEQGYPLASDWFDLLARHLPDDPTRPWIAVVRAEIEAGRRLAGALRALSERRNLAAANHLEKLLGEHRHSYLVMVLP